jgi:enamine deaminase RidA (YjgF/YER057c/UK114 family)
VKVKRNKIFSGTPWEPKVGYARAVHVGDTVYVSGTTATDASGNIVGVGNMYEQTVQTIKNIQSALERLGLTLDHVVRTRIYVTDIDRWEEAGKAHAEFFGQTHPATSLVAVTRLVNPEMLIEMEAVAVV